MFTRRWRIARLFGVAVYLDLSWLLILALLSLTLSAQFRAEGSLARGQALGMGLVAALGFFACIVLHELGHATAARDYRMPIGGITLFLFGGMAELEGEPPSAAGEFVVAVAGPVVSAVLAGLFQVLALAGREAGWPIQVELVLRQLAVMYALTA
jgi:Zn-dependent protease